MESKTVGRNIERILIDHKTDRVTLAKYLKVSPQTVGYWIRGEKVPRLKYVDKMCGLFGCDRTDIFGSVDPNVDDAITELTPDERELIRAYRASAEPYREAIRNMIIQKTTKK